MKAKAERLTDIHEQLEASKGMPHILTFEYATAADGSAYARLYIDGKYALSHYEEYGMSTASNLAKEEWLNHEYRSLLGRTLSDAALDAALERAGISLDLLGSYYHGMSAYILTDKRSD